MVSCVENKGFTLYIVCYFAYTIVPSVNKIEPWFLNTVFWKYDIINTIGEMRLSVNDKVREVEKCQHQNQC